MCCLAMGMGVSIVTQQFLKAAKTVGLGITRICLVFSVFELLIEDI